MIIPEIKLTQSEMVEAVGAFLKTKGISVPVESVEKNYSGSGSFRIALIDPDDKPVPINPEPETPPSLPALKTIDTVLAQPPKP